MPVYARIGGAWRQAKLVWWWDGSAWVKAKGMWVYVAGVWQQGFDNFDMSNDAVGATDSGSFPATITFTWTTAGQRYGSTIVVKANGIDFSGALDATVHHSGYTAEVADPTATWTVETYDGNNDLVRTRTATITGP